MIYLLRKVLMAGMVSPKEIPNLVAFWDFQPIGQGDLTSCGQQAFHWNQPIFDPGDAGPDFTVAQRDHPHWPDYPTGRIQSAEGFTGSLGGLAVYDRALSAAEITSLTLPLP